MCVERREESHRAYSRAAISHRCRCFVGQQKRGGRVIAFEHKAFAKHFITPQITRAIELGKRRQPTVCERDGAIRRGGVFKKKQISKPRCVNHAKHPFAVRHPEIARYAKSFFSTVVEVVAKTSALRFEFYCRNKFSIAKDNDIPILLRAIIPGDRNRPVEKYL